MAVSGKLLVERGSIDAPSQDWGDYDFIAIPSPGDRIAAQYEGSVHYLTVLSVHHRPVAKMNERKDREFAVPEADIVAKWTGMKD